MGMPNKMGMPNNVAVLDHRFHIEWVTEVTDKYGTGEKRTVSGRLIMTADTIHSALEYADDLTDVDFFYPNDTFSSSSQCVLSGEVTVRDQTCKDLSIAWPELAEADFDEVEIVSIQKL